MFYVPLDTNKSFRRRFLKRISWLGSGKKLNLTQQKHAFTNQKKYSTSENKHKTKARFSRLFTTSDGNGAGLFSKEKISEEKIRIPAYLAFTAVESGVHFSTSFLLSTALNARHAGLVERRLPYKRCVLASKINYL